MMAEGVVLDGEIFSLIVVENEQAEQASPDQKKGEKSSERFSHVF
jgi:hypothetical protein